MAGLDSKHVTWEGLQYYDSRIKEYVDNIVSALEQTIVTPEEKQEIEKRLEAIVQQVTINQTNIQSLFSTKSEMTSNIDKLFEFDRENSLKIENIATKIESLATKEDVATSTADIKTLLDDVKELEDSLKIDHVTLEDVRLALIGKADIAYVDAALSKLPSVDLNNYYTKEEVDDLIPEVSNLITEEKLDRTLDEFATEAEVSGLLQAFAEFDEHLEEEVNKKADKSSLPTKVSQLENDVGYLTEHQPLDNYVTKEDLQDAIDNIEHPVIDLSGYATEEFVLKKIAEAELADQDVDLSAYYTKSETAVVIQDAIDAINIPTKTSDLDNDAGYITDKDLPDISHFITMEDVEAKGYLTEHQDISGKADKSDLVGLATESYVNTAIENIPEVDLSDYATQQFVLDKIAEVPTDYLKEVPSEYITESELSEELAKIEHPTVDLTGYATEQWVTEQGFLKEHQDLSDYAKKSELPTDYLTASDIENKADKDELTSLATKQEVASVEEKIPNVSNFVTKDEVPSLDGYATEQFVTDAISNIKHPDPDLSNYYTKGETDSAIEEAVSSIKIPEVNLDPYATKAQVAEQIATKADNVPFTTDMFVTSELGNFAYGDNLNGLSVTTILTKLLGLQSTIVPDDPEEPKTLVDKIIAEQIPMYSIKGMTVTEVPFAHYIYTEEEAKQDKNSSGFYQITDSEGTVIESGYQDIQIVNDDAYYIFALPRDIDFETMVTVKVYDALANDWTNANSNELSTLTSDRAYIESICSEDPQMYVDAVNADEYTLYMLEEAPNGKHYRFAIKEQ